MNPLRRFIKFMNTPPSQIHTTYEQGVLIGGAIVLGAALIVILLFWLLDLWKFPW
jgi:hypothetical protein